MRFASFALLGTFALAASAPALTFGTYAYKDPGYTIGAVAGGSSTLGADTDVEHQQGGQGFTKNQASLTFGALAGGYRPLTGTVTVFKPAGTLVGTITSGSGAGTSFFSFSGTVSFTGGTGAYAGYTGLGTLSGSFYTPGGGGNVVGSKYPGQLNIGGVVNAVPEPASLAALSVGAVTLLRRRRRA